MKKWLKILHAPKFYRYWYYRQYILSKSLGDDTAEHSSVIGSSIILMSHLTLVLFLIGNGVLGLDIGKFLFKEKRVFEGLGIYVFIVLFCYLIFYYNQKWKLIISEFKDESKTSKKRGLIYLLIYLTISLLCLLPICITFFMTPGK